MTDAIHIEDLEVRACVGVEEDERAVAQRLTVNLCLEPRSAFCDVRDRLEATVDYVAVCRWVQGLAAARPRRLLETLAEEIAMGLLEEFPLAQVRVEVRKYVLPQTAYVAVRVTRPL